MNKNTSTPQDLQLSLFDYSPRPSFDRTIRRVTLNNEIYFSVYDVFKYHGDGTGNHRREWEIVSERLIEQGFEVVSKVTPHKFGGKGQRLTPVATFNTFLRIAMTANFKNWEQLRQYMADVTEQRLEETVNPELGVERAIERQIQSLVNKRGMSPSEAHRHIIRRQNGRATRNETTDLLKVHVIDKVYYGTFTDKAEYTPLFEMVAKEISKITGHSDARDGMTTEALAFIDIAESQFNRQLKQRGSITFQEAVDLMLSITRPLGLTVRMLEKMSGIDFATGRKLLKSHYDWE